MNEPNAHELTAPEPEYDGKVKTLAGLQHAISKLPPGCRLALGKPRYHGGSNRFYARVMDGDEAGFTAVSASLPESIDMALGAFWSSMEEL